MPTSSPGAGLPGTEATQPASMKTAAIADVSVNKKTGKVTVTHVYQAFSAGLAVYPGGIENQMVGGVTQILSRLLVEQMRYTQKQVDERGLRQLSAPALQGQPEDHPDRHPAHRRAARRRRRAGDRRRARGGRERVLRRDGRPDADSPADTGPGACRSEGGRRVARTALRWFGPLHKGPNHLERDQLRSARSFDRKPRGLPERQTPDQRGFVRQAHFRGFFESCGTRTRTLTT